MMSADHCPECGANVAGGRLACQALYDEIAARAYNDPQYASVRDLGFDAYCMQHIDIYCRSAKSYAAHLTRLCCGLEFNGSPAVYAAIQRWLNGRIAIEKPAILAHQGSITIADVYAARSGKEHRELVQAWAANVWAAYAEQQDLARLWIIAALNTESPHKRAC